MYVVEGEKDVDALRARVGELGLTDAVKFYLRYVPVGEVAGLFASSGSWFSPTPPRVAGAVSRL